METWFCNQFSSLSMNKESSLTKRKWFTNIVRIVRTYFVSNRLTLNVSNEGYSRDASCALNYISTFLLLYLHCIFGAVEYLWTNFSGCLWEGSCLAYVSCVCLCIVYIVLCFCFECLHLVCPMFTVSLDFLFWLPFRYSLTLLNCRLA
jgi:hypothetical protein